MHNLNVDVHLHTNLDPVDGLSGRGIVKHTPEQLFAVAQKKGLQILALTHHNRLIYTPTLAKQAKEYGITLIPALEATIEGAHVVILNPSRPEYTTFKELAIERRVNPHCFVYAPHPYYPGGSGIGKKLEQHIDLFDGIEYCHFYFSFFNVWNKRAVSLARKYGKTVIGTSDAHHLRTLGSTYSILRTPSFKIEDIIASFKQPLNVKVVTKPVSIAEGVVVLSDVARTLAYFVKKE